MDDRISKRQGPQRRCSVPNQPADKAWEALSFLAVCSQSGESRKKLSDRQSRVNIFVQKNQQKFLRMLLLTNRLDLFKMARVRTVEESDTEVLPPNGFVVELSERIGELRSALGRMLAELGSPKSASDLHKASGAGQTICWQVFRIVNSSEVASEARRAPSPSSLKRLLAAASNLGVSEKTVQAVQSSAEAFQAFSKRAAGDRAAFDSMVAGVSSEESSERILLSQRRAVYRGLSHIWGVQTDLQYFGSIVRRSESGQAVDSVTLSVQRGIRRLRPDCSVTLFGVRTGPVSQNQDARPTVIDTEAAERYGMPVLPQFSSQPLPKVEKIELPSGWALFNTVGHEIGAQGNLNCAFGGINRDKEFTVDTDGRRLTFMSFSYIRKPVAMSILEWLIHRPSFPNVKPELKVYQHQEGDLSQEAARRAMQFPIDERLAMVGRADKVELMDVPRYSEMLRVGADSVGWDLSEFDAYRFRMPYPIMFSESRIFFYVD